MSNWSISTNGPLIVVSDGVSPVPVTIPVMANPTWAWEDFGNYFVVMVPGFKQSVVAMETISHDEGARMGEAMTEAYLEAYSYAYRRGL